MKVLILFFFFSYSFIGFSQKQQPKLVIGIVVDQMRYDYLTRYWDKYGEGGFKKLIKEGFNCKRMNYNYMPTYTGPGHASIYTGTTPSGHGIIANDWYDKVLGSNIYCTGDAAENTIGSASLNGKMSPKNLISTTITDELKLATNNKAKVIGLSLKDRGAILPVGHKGDAAYWFDGGDVGKWISSSFYMKELPLWLQRINADNHPDNYLRRSWETLYSVETYTESIADNNKYEGLFEGETAPVFPHQLSKLRSDNHNYSLIKYTPFGNSILKDLALATIVEEGLGLDEFPDFLTVSFSSTDYIGHKYGPRSVEVEDTYLRLDKDLEEILSYLENNFKKEEVLIFLTADHGAVDVPQYLIDNELSAGYFDWADFGVDLTDFLKEKYKSDSLVLNISNYQVFLNHNYIARNGLDVVDIADAIAQFGLSQTGVTKVVTSSTLRTTEFSDQILANAQRGFYEARSGDVLFVLESGWISSWYTTGTTHGSPYSYDTHVPLLWYGAGVKKGSSDKYLVIPDISATLAVLLGIQTPSACTGSPILQLLD
jgi:predicted AlkP superfamily pyrophosphatase or phosphodiesterase